MMKKGLLKNRMRKMTAWFMSIILTCSSVGVPVHAEADRTLDTVISDVSLLEKTQDDVTPGDIVPEDAAPGDVTPEDVAPGDVTPEDVALGDVTSEDVEPRDVTPDDVTPGNAANQDVIHNDETSNDITSDGITPGTIASYFPDKNLAAAVAQALYLETDDPVTQEDLDGVYGLYIDTVTDWTGIEKLTKLNSVNLQATSAYDIANLEGLMYAPYEEITLYIYSNYSENLYGDISVLGKLTNLVSLYGNNMALSGDISSLSDLKKLENLSLYNTNISGNIGDLATLENLQYLDLSNTKVTGDLSDLGSSTKLYSLNLSGTTVRTKPADAELFPELYAGQEMFTLPTIDVANSILTYDRDSYSYNGISIKTNKNNSLANVTINGEIISPTNDSGEANYYLVRSYNWNEEKQTNEMSGNLTFSLDYLSSLTPGTYYFTLDFYWGGEVSGKFTIESTGKALNEIFPDKYLAQAVAASLGISDITTPVAEVRLQNMQSLTIDAVTDWTGIEKLTNLYYVYLHPTSTYDIANLAGLVDIPNEEISLYIYSSNSENIHGDISVLGKLNNLVSLSLPNDMALSGNISSLSDLKKLKSLTISGFVYNNDGFNISLQDLQDLVSLEFLDISNYNITGDISALSKMTSLNRLFLYSTNVSGNIGEFAELENLEYLDLSNTKVSGDLSDLGSKTKLYSLNLSGTTVRTKPADAELFPKLNSAQDMFTLPTIDVTNSILTYDRDTYIYPGISIKTNKTNNSLANVMLNGEIISPTNDSGEANYTLSSYKEWNVDTQRYEISGTFTFSLDIISTLTPGTYDFTLDFYWGGEVSGTFTIVSTGKALNELFPDEYLAKAVASSLGISDITTPVAEVGLQNINWLMIDTVTDWTGIEKLTKLNSITLRTNSTYDIANLAGLVGAPNKEITLNIDSFNSENIHGDISVLGKLPNLISLSLSNNTALSGDISSLSDLKKLKSLSIIGQNSNNDGIKGSLQDLQDLVSLENLYINNYNITGDIGDLAILENLQYLDLNNTKVSGDLSDFGPNTKLYGLNLSGTTVRVKPADAELFPNIYSAQDMFTLPTIDVTNSILTYDRDSYIYPGISIRTNKYSNSLASVMLNDEIISPTNDSGEANYTLGSSYNWNEEKQTFETSNNLTFSLDFLSTLNPGTYDFTMDFYWGGEVSGAFTIVSTGIALNELFPDKYLAQAVAESLEINDITTPVAEVGLQNVQSLRIDAVTDWTGIKKLAKLNTISLQATSTYDIANLAGLSDAPNEEITLSIYANYLEGVVHGDISVLGKLPNLVSLNLGYNTALSGNINSISNLKKLKNLSIELQYNNSDGIKGSVQDLQDLVSLESLYINNDNITGDISAFTKMTSLFSLSLYNTNVFGNIGDLATLENLESLNLSYTKVSGDLSDMGSKANLHVLNLSNTSVRVKPADAVLFPNLYSSQDMFTLPAIDVANSILTYDRDSYTYPGIRVNTNKYSQCLAYVLINDETISPTNDSGEANYTLDGYYGWNEETQKTDWWGNLNFSVDFLSTLTPGTYDFTLDFYWGGEVSGTFTIISTGKPLNEIIPDKYLAKAVAASLGFSDITTLVSESGLQNVHQLTIDTVTDWSGIEKLTNLTSVTVEPTSTYDIANLAGLADAPNEEIILYIYANYSEGVYGDISVLGELPNLVSLTLSYITALSGDISSLSDLKKLKRLTINSQYSYMDGIKGSLEDLQDLVSLEYLQINNNNITGDINNLKALSKLSYLSLFSDSIGGSLDGLSDLTSLQSLSITAPVTGDLKSLSKLSNLYTLDLSSDKISGSLSDLSTLTSLSTLYLYYVSLGNSLQGLGDLPNLYYLNINNNTINDSLGNLGKMNALNYLYLSGDMHVTIDNISGLSNLRSLSLDANLSDDLSQLGSLKSLTELTINGLDEKEYTIEWNLSDIISLGSLRSLSLNNLNITGDISAFSKMTSLTSLSLYNTNISGDISAFSKMTSLSSLSLNNTNVSGNISAFSKMTSLSNLSLYNINVSGNIGDLATLENLQYLYLYNTKVSGNLSDLGPNTKLYSLYLSGTPVRTKPTDVDLFPNLSNSEEMFTAPMIDIENSILTYEYAAYVYPGISIKTNKSQASLADFKINGESISPTYKPGYANYFYDSYYDWNEETQTYTVEGYLTFPYVFINTLLPGTYDYTLDFYWGGEVSGTFTVTESGIHTVVFQDYDGSILKTQTVSHGEDAAAPIDPVREGYTFKGWDTSFTNVMESFIVTALYEANIIKQYAVTFKDWDGTIIGKPQLIDAGKGATAPANPKRTGYKFSGWNKEFSQVTENMTVTATYQANTFTVTFLDYNGEKLDSQTVAYGKPAKAPMVPERAGYQFVSWDKGFSYITEDITVTATYQMNSDNSYVIEEPGTYTAGDFAEYGKVFIRTEGVTIENGSFSGNIYVEAGKAQLNNLSIVGSVFLTSGQAKVSNSVIDGSLTASAESILLDNLDIRGNVTIGASDITLQGGTISGNLTIETTVADGNVTITGIDAIETILYVRGGGSNSIIIEDSELGAIVVDKPDTAGDEVVRISVEGTTEVANVIVNSAAIIEDTTTTKDTGIQNVTLAQEIPANTTVELRGAIKEVTVQKEALKVVNNAAVDKLQVEVPSLTLVNNESVAELKLEKEAVKTKVEGNKVETTDVATGGQEPVYIFIPGDPTGDGTVNIFDIMAVRNVIFGTEVLTGSAFSAADVDSEKDGTLNIFDIMAIRNIIFE
jgi:Leucine-rich repeat (LRR) protein